MLELGVKSFYGEIASIRLDQSSVDNSNIANISYGKGLTCMRILCGRVNIENFVHFKVDVHQYLLYS